MTMTKSIRQIVRDVPQHWVGDGFPVRSLFTYADADRFDPFQNLTAHYLLAGLLADT